LFLFSLLFLLILVGVPLAGFLLAEAAVHGLNPVYWPVGTLSPSAVAELFWKLRFSDITAQFVAMSSGIHPAFADGGRLAVGLIGSGTLYALVCWFFTIPTSTKNKKNDPDAQFGGARFATPKEKARLSSGLEIGIDPQSGRPVRVRVESNLLSIAPPRTGKTSAFIINNLLAPDANAWSGSAVVIDPKGEVYEATQRRRRALGRPVYCLDLRTKPSGNGRWNPLIGLDTDDVLYLQRAALALLPSMKGENAYFRDRGSMFLAGVIAAAILGAEDGSEEDGPFQATPSDIERLLNNRDQLAEIAARHQHLPIMRSLSSDLHLDERSLSPLISTAQQGIKWLLNPQTARLVAVSTIDLVAVARGQADLFVAVPTENMATLAPLLRWLMVDLLQAMRTERDRSDKRVVLFVDEAANLGEFRELLIALGEMPGRGLSTWTFWQNRGQIEDAYGTGGSRTVLGTADVSTFSNISGLGPEDAKWASDTLGATTQFVKTTGTQSKGTHATASTGQTPQSVPLMTPADIRGMPGDQLVVVLTGGADGTVRPPMVLRKVRYFTDRRFKGLYEDIAPPAAT
jgi:type IV secretion system protein VirD4